MDFFKSNNFFMAIGVGNSGIYMPTLAYHHTTTTELLGPAVWEKATDMGYT